MEIKELKNIVDSNATKNGFEKLFGAWFKESSETIIALILVKSNYSQTYYLRIKVNLKKAFGQTYTKDKDWVKHDIAHVLLQPDKKYNNYFDLTNTIKDLDRKEKIEELFFESIVPMTNLALTRQGLIELNKQGKLILFNTVKNELGIK